MKYRLLGNTGIQCSVFAFGSWVNIGTKLNVDETLKLLDYSFNHGINLIDTAEIYAQGRAEEIIGDALTKLKYPRSNYLLCTKVFWGGKALTANGLNRKHIRDACDNSLKKLKVDYIDFYLCHRLDYHTPIIETVLAMNLLIKQGKILFWGTSEWEIEQVLEAYYLAKTNNLIGPSLEQFEYNMFCRQKAEISYRLLLEKTGIGALTTMPLCYGILTGKYSDTIPYDSRANISTQQWLKNYLKSEEGCKRIEVTKELVKLANNYSITMPQLAFAWILKNKYLSSILLGVSSVNQLDENIKSLEYVSLINNTLEKEIELLLLNKPIEPERSVATYNEVVHYG